MNYNAVNQEATVAVLMRDEVVAVEMVRAQTVRRTNRTC